MALNDSIETSSKDGEESSQHGNKHHHRHTPQQIQTLEAFFNECPHPDDKQRKDLSRQLKLSPSKVKFWFQNKRTQMKTQKERHENKKLKTEIDKLRAEIAIYKEGKVSCPKCGFQSTANEMSLDNQQLHVENARSKDEINLVPRISTTLGGNKNMLSSPHFLPGTSSTLPHLEATEFSSQTIMSFSNLIEIEKSMIIELAMAALDEFLRMACTREPLWLHNSGNSCEILNEEKYTSMFPRQSRQLDFKTEASRDTSVVVMNHNNLVEILMDVNQWKTVFSTLVLRASIVEILSTVGTSTYDGAMQVTTSELQIPSPLVATREIYFVRYCKRFGDGNWAVVDVSLDNLRPAGSNLKCRRRPSGCLIQELSDGYSKVTWIEHVEVDDSGVHKLYKPIVNSTLAFGAKRWLATLERHAYRLASSMANNINSSQCVEVISSAEARKSILKVAEKMVLSFCTSVGMSTGHIWTILSAGDADDIRTMMRNNVLSVATSFWLPTSSKKLFEFLQDKNSRCEWDILSDGCLVQEIAHIINGHDADNAVSLMRIISVDSSQSDMLVLQETFTDSIGSYVIYAPVDNATMDAVLSGGEEEPSLILPSGFAILPDGVSGGSVVTIALQMLNCSTPTGKEAVKHTMKRIEAAICRGRA